MVRWTDREWTELVEKAAKLRLKRPNGSLRSILAAVMKQLPENRRRVITASMLKNLSEELVERYKKLLGCQEEVDDLRQKVETLYRQRRKEERVAFRGESALVAEQLVAIIQRMERAETRLIEIMERAAESKPLPENEPGLPRVCLVGFLPAQGQIIAHALENVSNITVWPKEKQNLSGQFNVVVVWTRFVSHATASTASSHAERIGATVVFHDGGLGTVVDKIEKVIGGT